MDSVGLRKHAIRIGALTTVVAVVVLALTACGGGSKGTSGGGTKVAGGTAYWVGSLDGWATISLDAGGIFGISLEPVSGSAGSPAILAADLGS